MNPEVIQSPPPPSTLHHSELDLQLHPASSVLRLGEEDEERGDGYYNFWLAEPGETTGQGFTVKVDSCPRLIAGVQIKNKGKGSKCCCPNCSYDHATRGFKVSGAKNETEPFELLLEDELVDTTGNKAASLLDFTFDKAVEVQYLRFDLVSYWGHGGGLQYFAPNSGFASQIVNFSLLVVTLSLVKVFNASRE